MKTHTLLPWAGMLLSAAACAGPADYVWTPGVEYGERELDFKTGSARGPAGAGKDAAKLGLGFGLTPYWFTEVYGAYRRATGSGYRLEAVEWENKFQLTETGKYPLDLGLIVELEVPRQRNDAYEIKFGPLMQTEFGKLQLNGNLVFERKFRDGNPHDTELLYQYQAKYRLDPGFEFGLQGFGEVGEWDAWKPASQREHRLGPAVFGKFRLGDRQAIKYNAAYLVGTTEATPDRTFRMQIEYEF